MKFYIQIVADADSGLIGPFDNFQTANRKRADLEFVTLADDCEFDFHVVAEPLVLANTLIAERI